jgi:hypothetical protein
MLFYQNRISEISVLASTRENGIPHFLHTSGTIYCGETGVHISAFNKVLLQLRPFPTVDVVTVVDASTTATALLCRPYDEKN